MREELSPACEALIEIILGETHHLSRRIEASEALLSYEAPEEAVDLAREFLMAVYVNKEVNLDHRLKALKLARKIEAPKTAPPPSTEGSTQLAKTLAIARRRTKLMSKGLWPAPPGWHDDLDAMDFEPAATGTVADPAQALNAARLRRKSQRDAR